MFNVQDTSCCHELRLFFISDKQNTNSLQLSVSILFLFGSAQLFKCLCRWIYLWPVDTFGVILKGFLVVLLSAGGLYSHHTVATQCLSLCVCKCEETGCHIKTTTTNRHICGLSRGFTVSVCVVLRLDNNSSSFLHLFSGPQLVTVSLLVLFQQSRTKAANPTCKRLEPTNVSTFLAFKMTATRNQSSELIS